MQNDFFFVFMLKMVFFKKDIFMMIFFKTLPYFLSLFFPFLLLPDLSCHFFFSFSYMPGQSRVSTVLFALYLSLFFFPPISTTGWFVLLNGGRSSHKGCPQLERQLGLSLNVKLQPSNIKHDGSAEQARRQ
jgi:hypothetical protein